MTIRELAPWNWGSKQVEKTPESNGSVHALHRQINRMFDDFFDSFDHPLQRLDEDFMPRIRIEDTDESFSVMAELPGMTEKDVTVQLEQGVLTLKGEKREETHETKHGEEYSEIQYGSFFRQIPLPANADTESASATFKNGTLSVDVKKTASAKEEGKRIPIESA